VAPKVNHHRVIKKSYKIVLKSASEIRFIRQSINQLLSSVGNK